MLTTPSRYRFHRTALFSHFSQVVLDRLPQAFQRRINACAHRAYRYAHDFEEKTTTLETLPPELRGTKFYLPNDLGNEKEIQKRYLYWEALKKKLAKEEP